MKVDKTGGVCWLHKKKHITCVASFLFLLLFYECLVHARLQGITPKKGLKHRICIELYECVNTQQWIHIIYLITKWSAILVFSFFAFQFNLICSLLFFLFDCEIFPSVYKEWLYFIGLLINFLFYLLPLFWKIRCIWFIRERVLSQRTISPCQNT